MNFVTRALSSVTEFYKDLNPATLSGAIDVIVLEQPNGELSCTPFHVRFGKLRLLRPQDKVVEVRVNGELTDFQMKLGDQGEAFFVVASEVSLFMVFLMFNSQLLMILLL
jgi:phosphatidate phosphatase LPIN